MNVLSLFDGIATGKVALERAGIVVENYYSSEIDKYAIQIAKARHPDMQCLGDVTSWKTWDIDWKSIDLLLGGSPCQGFSKSGKLLNFSDPRSVLFFTYCDILDHIRSVNPNVKFLLENVVMKYYYVETINKFLGLEPVKINSQVLSAQLRDRLYWFNWEARHPILNAQLLEHVIESGYVDREKAYCIDAGYHKGTNLRQYSEKNRRQLVYLDSSCTEYRMLTPVECERLQTLPDNYTYGCSNKQRYKMLGNAWTVNVIAHLLRYMR